jgi:hypothetical protein
MTSTMTRVAAADIAPGDTSKHVKYTFGMLLGVDDFTQEFAYLSGRDRWLARDLAGYGTVWGLSIAMEKPPEGGLRVNVDRGVGLTPLGQLVCVPSMQCAYLDPWLVKHGREVADKLGGVAGTLPIYVVLCYRSRATDNVPIPGEPCRTEDELTAASRWQDDFELELRLAPPAQVEEIAIREFVGLLRNIEIVDAGGSSPLAFIDGLRAAALPQQPPPEGSPPAAGAMRQPEGLAIPRDELTDYLRAAFRLWVTEIRPQYRLDVGCGADECPPDDSDACLLLAELALPIEIEAAEPVRSFLDPDLTADAIEVHEEARPYLLHERMLQEWMLGATDADQSPAGGSTSPGGGTTGTGTAPGGGTTSPGTAPGAVVAAGQVDDTANNLLVWSWGDLSVSTFEGSLYRLEFPTFDVGRRYVVKGTPIRPEDSRMRVFEVVSDKIVGGLAGDAEVGKGIYVRLVTDDSNSLKGPFMVEISDFGAPA